MKRVSSETGVSVVIPAYNEEGSVGETVKTAINALSGADYEKTEVIVVDDGSTDRTAEEATKAGAVVYSHPHNVGYGLSLKHGIGWARYDTIIIADADGTYPLDKAPDLLSLYDQGFDMVVGKRTGTYLNETVVKGWLRWILRFMVEYSADRKVPDVNSGFRVFSRATATEHFSHLCDTFSFTTTLTLAYMMNGRFVHYVPIEYGARIGTTKVKLLKESLRTFLFILQATIYYNPLKLFILISSILFCTAIFTVILSIILQVLSGFMLGVGFILVGVIIFALGLLADLLRQIMDSRGARAHADMDGPAHEAKRVDARLAPMNAGADNPETSQ